MKETIKKAIKEAVAKIYPEHGDMDFAVDFAPANVDADFASNAALVLGKKLGKKPMEVAEAIRNGIKGNNEGKGLEVETAAPGFLNFKLSEEHWHQVLAEILEKGERYGNSDVGRGKKVNIESVSANPTGPLTVGHGRGAIIGLVLSNVLKSQGYEVVRDYYYNDAGLQMKVLGISVKARASELFGKPLEISGPSGAYDLYQGAYIQDIARQFIAQKELKIADDATIEEYSDFAAEIIFDWIKNTLNRLGVSFDNFVKESDQETETTLKLLEKAGVLKEKDGAKWLKNIEGREDRVLVRKTGEPTYRLPDIAYHLQKVRQYDKVITVLGADHIGQFPDISYAVEKLGGDAGRIKVIINQFVTLGGGKKMSTRKAEYVTLDELVEEVGPDVTKFFFAMISASSHMNFDIGLARDTSEKNPLYKVQYAYARINSIFKKSGDKTQKANVNLALLKKQEELDLIKELAKCPELFADVAQTYAVHQIPHYLLRLADRLHSFYEKVWVIGENRELTQARLALMKAVKTVLANGLRTMGIEPLERM